MNRQEFLETLGRELSRSVPIKERMDILRYYQEYFDEAGPEREAEVVQELGDPVALAHKIMQEEGYTEPLDGEYEPEVPRGRKRTGWIVAAAAAVALALVMGVRMLIGLPFMLLRNVAVSSDPVEHTPYVTIIDEVEEEVSDIGVAAVEGVYVEGFASLIPKDGQCIQFGEITDILVDVSLGDVIVQSGGEYTLTLSWNESRDYYFSYDFYDGVLTVNSHGGIGLSVNAKDYDAKVIVTVPRDAVPAQIMVNTGMGDIDIADVSTDDLNLYTSMGDIDVEDVAFAQTLSAETSMGDIDVEAVYVEEDIGLTSGMGDVELTGMLAMSNSLDSGMGSITVETFLEENEVQYVLDCGMGEARVNDRVRGQHINSSAMNGSDYDLYANAGMGDIRVDFGK